MTFSARCEFGRLRRVVELDVVELGAADHPLLLCGRQRSSTPPCRACTSGRGHSSRRRSRDPRRRSAWRTTAIGPVRVLGAVDEAHQVAVVEELEAVHLVDDRDGARHRVDDPAGQLEADVHRLGADVEQQIARRRRGVVPGRPRARRTDAVRRARSGEQPVPRVGADRGDHRQVLGGSRKPIARTRPERSASASCTVCFAALVDGGDQKDGRRRQRRQNRLRRGSGHHLTLASRSAEHAGEDGEHVSEPHRACASSSTRRLRRSTCARRSRSG